MGTGWDAADDDLEKLLEFDDLDALYAPDAGRQALSSDPLHTSASAVEARLASRVPEAASPGNSLDQFQSLREKQATGDLEILQVDIHSSQSAYPASDRCRDDEPHLQTSAGRASGGHGVWSTFRNREGAVIEGASREHMRRCENAAVSHHIVEEPLLSKQRRSNCEEAEDQLGGEDVRLLSGAASDKRAPNAATGVCLGSSQVNRVQARNRLCEDGDVESDRGRNDPMEVDEFAQQRMGRTKGGLPVDGRGLRAGESLLPRGLPAADHDDSVNPRDPGMHRTHDCASIREISPPPTVLGYKIPGPAGALQNCSSTTGHRTHGLRHSERSFGPGRPCDTTRVAADALDFREGPWLAAMEFLKDGHSKFGNHQPRTTIVTVKATKRHISLVVAVIVTVAPNGFGDMSVTLKDPTGSIKGSIHRRVLTDLEDGHLIGPGAVLVLRKVAVFSPTPRTHYLNITFNNVDRIFGKDTIAFRSGARAVCADVRNSNSGTSRREHSMLQVGLNHAPRSQPAATKGYELEPIAPNCDNSARRATELKRTPGNSEHVEADCPNPISPRSGKRPRNGLSLPTILEDVVNLRIPAARADVGVFEGTDPENLWSKFPVEAKATQEAIAKAAGWDLSEDMEALLADDFPFTQ